jgi:hypothetical protein
MPSTKRLLTALLALLGISNAVSADQKAQSMDPKRILFSIPTISDDLPPMDQGGAKPSARDFALDEDVWTQIEFLSRSQLPVVQRMLQEYKSFEAANRAQYGWRNTYVRKLERTDVIHGADALKELESILGIKAGPAPVLLSLNTVTGRVRNGFSVPLGGSVTVYGYTDAGGIPVLGALVGRDPDDGRLVKAFRRLNAKEGLILVDWRQQLVLISIAPSGQINTWRP